MRKFSKLFKRVVAYPVARISVFAPFCSTNLTMSVSLLHSVCIFLHTGMAWYSFVPTRFNADKDMDRWAIPRHVTWFKEHRERLLTFEPCEAPRHRMAFTWNLCLHSIACEHTERSINNWINISQQIISCAIKMICAITLLAQTREGFKCCLLYTSPSPRDY